MKKKTIAELKLERSKLKRTLARLKQKLARLERAGPQIVRTE